MQVAERPFPLGGRSRCAGGSCGQHRVVAASRASQGGGDQRGLESLDRAGRVAEADRVGLIREGGPEPVHTGRHRPRRCHHPALPPRCRACWPFPPLPGPCPWPAPSDPRCGRPGTALRQGAGSARWETCARPAVSHGRHRFRCGRRRRWSGCGGNGRKIRPRPTAGIEDQRLSQCDPFRCDGVILHRRNRRGQGLERRFGHGAQVIGAGGPARAVDRRAKAGSWRIGIPA